MVSKSLKIVLAGLFVVAGLAGIIALRLDGHRLRQRVADLRRQKVESDRLRDDNQQAQKLLARSRVDADDGVREIHTDVVRLRAEIADFEKRARIARAEKLAQTATDATALANNHDPERALTRLENFQNVGRAMPGAAFQTFVWAALKGEDATLAGMIAFPGVAREKAEAVVAGLPEVARTKFQTPEKLAALFFADALTTMTAAQITDVTYSDGDHAFVTIRGLTDRLQKVPMQLGTTGWQIIVPEGMTAKLKGWAGAGGSSAPQK